MSPNNTDAALPVHPGKYIQFELDARQETPAQLALLLGCPEAFLLSLLHGEASVTPELAFKLQKWCNTSMVLFLEMQLEFDRHHSTTEGSDPCVLEASASRENPLS